MGNARSSINGGPNAVVANKMVSKQTWLAVHNAVLMVCHRLTTKQGWPKRCPRTIPSLVYIYIYSMTVF